MGLKQELLLASAARLYSLGLDLEAARERLRELAARGVGYESEEMRAAYADFAALDRQWKDLEAQHLALREELLSSGKQEE